MMNSENEIVNQDDQTELAKVSPAPNELATLGSVEQMQLKLKDFTDCRAQIVAYIDDNFKEGVDYGPTDPRCPKATLKKAGAEKICRMFNTRPVWEKDADTWEMLGNPPGVVCYICRIIDNVTGKVVGEGRGAEKIGTKGRDANKTIKNAEKCALVDAALYTFCLSEMFTQDGGGAGAAKQTLADDKNKFKTWVTSMRSGCESSMSDDEFMMRVSETELSGRRHVNTIGELTHITDQLAAGNYDWATGDKIPPQNEGGQNG